MRRTEGLIHQTLHIYNKYAVEAMVGGGVIGAASGGVMGAQDKRNHVPEYVLCGTIVGVVGALSWPLWAPMTVVGTTGWAVGKYFRKVE